MQRHFLLPRPSCVITARLRNFRGWGTLQASLSVLNSISATRGFIATLKCLNKITLPFLELGFSCLKKKKKGKRPCFLCASHFSLVHSVPVGLFLLPEMLYSAWYLHQAYFNSSNSQSSEAYF